uniref:Uncharacterized protein n=2 Tax=Tetranychus urticae TaxID=32264 RepID=T1KJY2_TETUR
MASCGCIFCSTCVQHDQGTCQICQMPLSAVSVKILTSRPCKYRDRGCTNHAQFLCKCVRDGKVCGPCLGELHSKRVSTTCIPEKISFSTDRKVNICQDCCDFIAEYHVPEQNKNVCFECKDEYTNLEKLTPGQSVAETEQIMKEFALTKRIMNCKKQKIMTILKQRENTMTEEAIKVQEATERINKDFSEYKANFQRENEEYKKQEETLTKIEAKFTKNGSISKVLKALRANAAYIQASNFELNNLLDFLRNVNILSVPVKRAKFTFSSSENLYQIMNYSLESPLDEKNETCIEHNTQSQTFNLEASIPTESQPSNLETSTLPGLQESQSAQDSFGIDRRLESATAEGFAVKKSFDGNDQDEKVQVTRVVSPFYICMEIPELVETRIRILQTLKEHRREWKQLKNFDYGDIAIVRDGYGTSACLKRGKIKYSARPTGTVRVFLLDYGFDIMVKISDVGEIPGLDLVHHEQTCFIGKLMDIKPPSNFIFPVGVGKCHTAFLNSLIKKHGARVTVTRKFTDEEFVFCKISQKIDGIDEDWSQLLIQHNFALEYHDNSGCFVPSKDYCYRFHGLNDCISCYRVHECPSCGELHSLIHCPKFSLVNQRVANERLNLNLTKFSTKMFTIR